MALAVMECGGGGGGGGGSGRDGGGGMEGAVFAGRERRGSLPPSPPSHPQWHPRRPRSRSSPCLAGRGVGAFLMRAVGGHAAAFTAGGDGLAPGGPTAAAADAECLFDAMPGLGIAGD